MNSAYDKNKKHQLLDKVEFRKHFKADKWEEYNRQFFDGLAPKYDFLNQILSFGTHLSIKKKMLANTPIPAQGKILDVCTGSGDIAIFLAKKFPGGQVIGVDMSEKMLEIARKRAGDLPNVSFQKEDALHLSFSDQTFDAVIISFGLRNLEDLEKGLLEFKRVTRPGGYVTSLDLGKIKGDFKKFLYTLYFRKFIPFLGKTIFHRGEFNSFQYLPESNEFFPSQEELVKIFEKIGLKNAKKFDFLFGAISQQLGQV